MPETGDGGAPGRVEITVAIGIDQIHALASQRDGRRSSDFAVQEMSHMRE
jgi:hypothetical protein